MIDYIQWLLEEPDKEPAETLAWRFWSPAGRARKTEAEAPDEGEKRVQTTLPDRRAADLRLGLQPGEGLDQEGRESGASLPGLGLGRERRFLQNRRETLRETVEAELAMDRDREGESLYRQSVHAKRLAGFMGEHRLVGVNRKQDLKASARKADDIRSLDRAFQRDARRYDGGFPLL